MNSKLKIVLCILLVLFALPALSQTAVNDTLAVTISDAGAGSQPMAIGFRSGASDGVDGNDVIAPPPGPAGSFDARIINPAEDLFTDIRSDATADPDTFEFSYRPSTGNEPLTMTWDTADLDNGTFRLVDAASDGILVDVDMTTLGGSVDLTNDFSGFLDSDCKIIYDPDEAIPEPDITVDPLAFDLGDVDIGDNASQTVTITNDGTSTLSVTDVSQATGTGEWSEDGGAVTLAPTESATFDITFTPTDAGAETATFEVTSDDPDEGTVTVTATANGVEPGSGTPIALDDDDSQEIPMNITFPFCGVDYTSVFVGSNGFLTFGAADTDFSETVPEFLNGAPRIAMYWDDLRPVDGGGEGVVSFDDTQSGQFSVTYDGVAEWASAPPFPGNVTFTITLFDDGTYTVDYGEMGPLDGLVGRTDGGGATDPGETDLSAASQPIGDGIGTVYELFPGDGLDDNDLSNFGPMDWGICVLPSVAELDVTPGDLTFNLAPDEMETQALTLTNIGDLSLNFSISDSEAKLKMPDGREITLQVNNRQRQTLAPEGNWVVDERGDRKFDPTAYSEAQKDDATFLPSAGKAPEDRFNGYTGSTVDYNFGGGSGFGIESVNATLSKFKQNTPEVLTAVAGQTGTGGFAGAGAFDYTDQSTVYQLDVDNYFAALDTTTGTATVLPSPTPPGAETFSGMAFDPTDGTLYAISTDITTSTLNTIDPATGATTNIGLTGMAGGIALAIDGNGNMWSYDIVSDNFFSVDKNTGTATLVGPLGFDANFGQGMAWDPASDQIFLTAFNNGAFQPELRVADTATGNTTFLGVLGSTAPGGLTQLGWVGIPGTSVPPVSCPWLTVDPTSGSLGGGESTDVDVTADATGLSEGTFNCLLTISGNFVNSPVEVPVVLNVSSVSGTPIDLGDDDAVEVPMNITFPFCGVDYTSVFVGSNGFLTFGAGDTDFSESVAEFLSGAPRIAMYWDDLRPGGTGGGEGTVSFDDTQSGQFSVTFDGVAEWASAPPFPGNVTFTVTLFEDGTYVVDYGQMDPADGLVGRTEGNGAADPGETDLSGASQPIGSGLATVYELFPGDGLDDNDLSNFGPMEWAPCEVPNPPELVCDPETINAELPEGETGSATLSLTNIGDLDATFNITALDGVLKTESGEEIPVQISAPRATDGSSIALRSGAMVTDEHGNKKFDPTAHAGAVHKDDGYAPSAGLAPADGFNGFTGSNVDHSFGAGSAFGIEAANETFSKFKQNTPDVLVTVAGNTNQAAFNGAGAFDYTDQASVYQLDVDNSFAKIDTSSGARTALPSPTAPGSETWAGLAFDPTDGTLYGLSTDVVTSTLSTIDPTTGATTTVGLTGMTGGIALAIDGDGNMWSYDIVSDNFFSVDKNTGTATAVGPLGFDANFGQGMSWDPSSDQIFLAAFNNGAFQPELRVADTATGNTTFLGVLGATVPGGLTQFGWVSIPGNVVPPTPCPFISAVDPESGTIPGGQSVDITIGLDASGLDEGEYKCTLRITGNFINGPKLVPVCLTVVGGKAQTILADEEVTLQKDAFVEGDIHSNDEAEYKKRSTQIGNVTASGEIEIHKQVLIDGDATAPEFDFKGGASEDNVTGTVTVAAVDMIPLPALPAITPGTEDVEVGEDETVDLDPGMYAEVEVREDATLNLSAGDYHMEDFKIGKRATINLDATAGEVNIFIEDKFSFIKQSTFNAFDGNTPTTKVTIWVGSSRSVKVRKDVIFNGCNLIAPNAKVKFQKRSFFKGLVCAREVDVQKTAVLVHHQSALTPKEAGFGLLAVDEDDLMLNSTGALPTTYELQQNFPNPFNPTTTIRFGLPEASELSLKIYNARGQLVRTLVNGNFEAGYHNFVWDATSNNGSKVASGIYFYQILGKNFHQVKKMILLK